MQSFLARALLLMAGVLIGIGSVAGVIFLLQDDTTSSPRTQTQTTPELESLPRPNGESSADANDSNNNDAAPTIVDQLVFPKRTFDRKATIVSWVVDLTDDEVVSWLEQSTDPSWQVLQVNRTELQKNLLQKLSLTAPERAVDFAMAREEQRDRYLMANTVFQVWANTDIDGAVARVKELNEQASNYFVGSVLTARDDLPLERMREIAIELGDENAAFTFYFQNLTRGEIENPRETWYEIVNLATRESVQGTAGYALSNVAAAWVEEKGLNVLDEIVSSISSDSQYSSILYLVFSEISAEQPEEIFDYMMSNLGDQANEIIQKSNITYHWARKDPKGALVKAQTLPTSGVRRTLVQSAVWEWSQQNPRQLLEQLELIPPSEHANASSNAIRALTQTSPTETAEFVLQVADDEMQVQLARNFVQSWVGVDAEAAKDWVLNLPAGESMRASLIPTLASSLVPTDPKGAFELALQQPIEENELIGGSDATGQEVLILSSIAWQDIDLAIELLPQVRDAGKVSAFSMVGHSLIRLGNTQQVLELADQLVVEQRPRYYQSIAEIWSMSDPKGLLKAFDDFPHRAKSRIALSVIRTNGFSNSYSDDEIEELEKHISEEDEELYNRLKEIDFYNPSSPEDQETIQQLYSW